MQAQKKVHFQQKAWVNTIMCLVSFWYWRWFNSLLSLILRLGLPTPFFLDSEDSFARFFSLVRRCWASLFSLDSPLSFTLLHFSYSCLAITRFFFPLAFELKTFASFSCVVFGFFYFWKANVQFLDCREHFANHCKVFNSFNGKQSTFPKWVGHPMQIPEISIKNFKALFWILNHCKIIYSNR